MKIVAVIQARMGSTRLPGKMDMLIGEKSILWHVIHRLKKSKLINEIVLATSTNENNNILIERANEFKIKSYKGNENDVLDRFYQATKDMQPYLIIRITGDCPFLDPEIVDKVISLQIDTNADYASNIHPPTFPDGLDVEVIKFKVLKECWENAKKRSEREHVTPYIYNNANKFKIINLSNEINYSSLRFTLDEKEDLILLNQIYSKIGKYDFNFEELINTIKSNPKILDINQEFKRNEGYTKSLREDRGK